MTSRWFVLCFTLTACAPSEGPTGQNASAPSYGFGQNGTPDDIWEARNADAQPDILLPSDTEPPARSDIGSQDQDSRAVTDARVEFDDTATIFEDTPPAPDTNEQPDLDPGNNTCGNGVVDPTEECDFSVPGSCPTECFDPPGCTATILEGSAANCTARCVTTFTTELIDDDACCPPTGTPTTDSDCNLCGNGQLDSGESCDSSSDAPCPALDDCPADTACSTWSLTGASSSCDAVCVKTTIQQAIDGDGCCPVGTSETEDSDCIAICGDGIVSGSEACEPGVALDTTCAELGYSGGQLGCMPDCTITTITCNGDHALEYQSIGNIFLVGDIAHVAWHGSGDWALLVARDGTVAQYDPVTNALAPLETISGTPYDVGVTSDGLSFRIVGSTEGDAAVWKVYENDAGEVVVEAVDYGLSGETATCAVADASSGNWAICTRASGGGGYINRLYHLSENGELIATKAYSSSSGISDAMWTSTAYPGSNALVTTEGFNGAGSESWVLVSDLIVGNGWSPGFGNAGRAAWRPGGTFGISVGTSTNSVYVFDGAWQTSKVPSANNGAIGNSIAWKDDGSRALVVSRPTGSPLQGSVFDYRAGSTSVYSAAAWYNVSINDFDEPPYNGGFNTHLLDVAWRPGSTCDEGLIVGADNGTAFNPTFGLVVRFYDADDPDCL